MSFKNRKCQGFAEWLDEPKNLPFLSLIWGFTIGVLLILKYSLTTNGALTLIPYAILVIGFFWLIKKTKINYFHRFLAGLASYMVASLVLYLYIAFIINPKYLTSPIWVHSVRIGMMLVTAVIINGLMSYLQYRFKAKLS